MIQKTILVFKNGMFLKQINYPTKSQAKIHLKHFNKRGICDPNTGETIENAIFELM